MPLPSRPEFVNEEVALRGLRCMEVLYPPGLHLTRHLHEKPSLSLLVRGSYSETRGDPPCTTEHGPGSLVVRPAGEPHANDIGRRGSISLELEVEAELLDRYGLAIRHPTAHASALVERRGHRLRRALRGRERVDALYVESLALEILAFVFPRQPPPRERRPPLWLRHVCERIHADFRSDVSVHALAREAGVHPVHLVRAFRAHYRSTPGELVRALRVRWAAHQLIESRDPIACIATEAGYCDQSHLARAFRDSMGVSPSQYRRVQSCAVP